MSVARLRLRVLVLIGALALAGCAGNDDRSGSELYREACVSCHEREGVDLGPGSDRAASLTDAGMEDAIRNGVENMPAFGSTYSGEQIDRLIAYMRGLEQGAGGN